MVSNSYLDNLFRENLLPEENYSCYFYAMSFASTSKYILYGPFATLLNKHSIICFTSKRIICLELDPVTGNVMENINEIDLNVVNNITVKKGMLKTKIKVVFSDKSILEFSPNNICIGLSNHKKNLTKLQELYS